MKWLLNLSTRAKLVLGFGLMLLFLAAVTMTASVSFRAIQTAQQEIDSSFATAADLSALEANLDANRVTVLTMVSEARLGSGAATAPVAGAGGTSVDAREEEVHKRRGRRTRSFRGLSPGTGRTPGTGGAWTNSRRCATSLRRPGTR